MPDDKPTRLSAEERTELAALIGEKLGGANVSVKSSNGKAVIVFEDDDSLDKMLTSFNISRRDPDDVDLDADDDDNSSDDGDDNSSGDGEPEKPPRKTREKTDKQEQDAKPPAGHRWFR
jgi:hypothetical protein